MKNPLRKRILRELRDDFSKYLAIFLLMLLTIAFGSGFMISTDSMITAYNESFEKYTAEWGHFSTQKEMNRGQRKSAEELGITVYDLNYAEESVAPGTEYYGSGMTGEEATAAGLKTSTLRIYANRTEVDNVCVMSGRLAEADGEIAIDRMYADNNKISIGDTISSDSHSWTVVGLIAASDYSSLFANNNDTMFDAEKFGIALVTTDAFASFPQEEMTWNYAWLYDDPPADEAAEKEVSDDLLDELNEIVALKSFVPRYQNQAIQFTGEDFGSDQGMMVVLVYMVIVIIAFVFAITTNNTIQKEANVIGTLRASGYTRGELIRHYMTAPLIVTLISSLIGNIMGYTFMKDVCASMYYGSYSLPTFVTQRNANAFLMTTVVPMILMVVITFLMLRRALSLSPLQFLRRDLSRRRNSRAFPLSTHISFFGRFRIRVVLQNLPNYLLMFIGILFANLMLLFGLAMPDLMNIYANNIEDQMFCNYQYILTVPVGATDDDNKLESLFTMMRWQADVETDNETAEKFSAWSLNTLGDYCKTEEITLYGIAEDSRYLDIDTDVDGVIISSAYADKYQLEIGNTITLKEKYETTTYDFRVGGIYDYEGGLCIFMDQTALNETFDLDKDMFSGYFSETPITDIDADNIGTTIDIDSMTKVSRQLMTSMGDLMYLFDAFAILIFLVVMFVMSKIIIEKNAQSISMSKILGYTNPEIGQLYILSTTIVAVAELLVSLPLEVLLLGYVYRVAMLEFLSGWLVLHYYNTVFVKMFLLGVGTYAIVAALELRRIRRVPMDQALKNVE